MLGWKWNDQAGQAVRLQRDDLRGHISERWTLCIDFTARRRDAREIINKAKESLSKLQCGSEAFKMHSWVEFSTGDKSKVWTGEPFEDARPEGAEATTAALTVYRQALCGHLVVFAARPRPERVIESDSEDEDYESASKREAEKLKKPLESGKARKKHKSEAAPPPPPSSDSESSSSSDDESDSTSGDSSSDDSTSDDDEEDSDVSMSSRQEQRRQGSGHAELSGRHSHGSSSGLAPSMPGTQRIKGSGGGNSHWTGAEVSLSECQSRCNNSR